MTDQQHYSDEHLNAFIDNQLSTAEKAELLDEIRHDSELSQRVCKLQKLHNLVQLSYQSINVPKRHQAKVSNPQTEKVKWFAAASVMLMIAALAGWFTNDAYRDKGLYELAEIIHHDGISNADDWRLMMHVSTASPARLNLVLDEAEALLEEYSAKSKKLQLEILTNSAGIKLVTNNNKQYNNRLQNLQQKYENLIVLACGKTIKRIQIEKGKKINLLPKTNIVPSAINQIVKRQKEGWSYIRI